MIRRHPGDLRRTNTWHIHCARCTRTDEITAKYAHVAHYTARRAGWSLTKKEGWVCPDCQPARDRPNPTPREE
ncbi:MAG: hypothetical protein JOZ41_02600 [Chloroflexi bacterium]|nr:hypothetical protein [Chloroflexota bacterium]